MSGAPRSIRTKRTMQLAAGLLPLLFAVTAWIVQRNATRVMLESLADDPQIRRSYLGY